MNKVNKTSLTEEKKKNSNLIDKNQSIVLVTVEREELKREKHMRELN